jgi:hypothetical protein
MNMSYQMYQAERPLSAAQQREADARAGELAAAVARLGRSLRHSVTGNYDARREDQRLARAALARAIPRPR